MQLSLLPSLTPAERRSHHERHAIPGPAIQAARERAQNEKKAQEQEAAVLAFFRANPGAWGPSQVWWNVGPREHSWTIYGDAEDLPERLCLSDVGRPKWLLTSIRARITTLTDKGELRMLMERRLNDKTGGMEHLWTIAAKEDAA